ncbi:mediator complex, subunit Med18 [Xylariaceae sp. FL0255]|nr:mediator complex, subunit Med18 [Xylariaceae sp. FL0255]
MHELFLTASIAPSDFDTASAILQGLTWMTARRTTYRILFFAGPPQPRGLPGQPPPTPHVLAPQYRSLWADLAKQLTRASYVLQACFEIRPDHFAQGADAPGKPMEFNDMNATLRWTEMPDPTRDSPVTSRKKIEIPFYTRLPAILNDNKHTYTNELIQETHLFIRDDVEIIFSRYYHVTDSSSSSAPPSSAPSPPRAAQHLPAWADLKPIDPAQKWVLTVKLNVPEDGHPEKLRKAHDELLRVKAEFEKLFDFRPVDRRVFDTRLAPPPGRMPP